MAKNNEKYTVNLIAKTKDFLKNMAKATKAMKLMGDMNRGLIKNLQRMSSATAKGGARFGQSVQKMKTGIDKVSKSSDKGVKSWKKYFKALAVGGAVIGGMVASLFLLRKAFNEAADAAAIQVQAKAFSNLAASYGKSSAVLLEGLREASKGTVDNLQLMTTASRAVLLGIPIGKLTQLMEVARAASKAMGTTVSGAFSDISLGIGRQSRLILDNLGIIVKVGSAYATYAEKIGTTADALTDYEKKQAFANAALEQGDDIRKRTGTSLIDFQDRIAKLQTSMTNLRHRFKGFFLAVFVTLDQFMQDSGLSTEIKELFNVTIPELLISRMETMLELLDRLGIIVKQINEEGPKETAKRIARDTGKSIGRGLLDFFILNPIHDVVDPIVPAFKAGFNNFIGRSNEAPVKTSNPKKDAEEVGQAIKEVNKEVDEGTSKFQKYLKLFDENNKKIQADMQGLSTPTKTAVELINEGFEKLEDTLNDTQLLASEVEQTFAITMDAIKLNMEKVKEPSKEMIANFERLQKIWFGKVKAESFANSIGVITEKQFGIEAGRNIAKFERLINFMNTGAIKIINPIELRKQYDTIFKSILLNVNRLEPELKKKFLEINAWMAANAVPSDSIRMGLNQWVDDYRNVNNRMQQIGKDTAVAISSSFENFFFDSVTGKLKSLRETFANFGKSILRSVSKALGNKATEELLNIFGFDGNTTAVNNNTTAVDKNTAALLLASGGGLGSGAAAPNPVVLASLRATGGIGQFGNTPSKVLIDESKVKEKSTAVTISVLDKVKKSMNDIYGKFSTFMNGLFKSVTGIFSSGGGATSGTSLFGKITGAFKSGGSLGKVGGFFSGIGGFVKKIFGFADGGITSLAGSLGGAMMTKKPTLAAISETGKREAIVPLDKFADMIQQPSITINAVDTKSFQQYINENKEILLGAINSVRSPQTQSTMQSGPF
jgi:hypothetical protein